MTYRVFGSPFSWISNQSSMYLRQKEGALVLLSSSSSSARGGGGGNSKGSSEEGVPLDYSMHVSSMVGTVASRLWYGCKVQFGGLSPEKDNLYDIYDLIHHVETRLVAPLPSPLSSSSTVDHHHDSEGSADALDQRNSSGGGEHKNGDENSLTLKETGSSGDLVDGRQGEAFCPFGTLVDRFNYPMLFITACAIEIYAAWWLNILGGMFRWLFEPEKEAANSTVVRQHLQYFSIHNFALPEALVDRAAAGLRQNLRQNLVSYGVREESQTFMEQKFFALTHYLEDHFTEYDFILGNTGKPTSADILLASAFEASLLKDDPPATKIRFGAPCLMLWMQRMRQSHHDLGLRTEGEAKRFQQVLDEGEAKRKVYRKKITGVGELNHLPDEVPSTLFPILELIDEVFPLLLAQCDSAREWMKAHEGLDPKREKRKNIIPKSSLQVECTPTHHFLHDCEVEYLQIQKEQEEEAEGATGSTPSSLPLPPPEKPFQVQGYKIGRLWQGARWEMLLDGNLPAACLASTSHIYLANKLAKQLHLMPIPSFLPTNEEELAFFEAQYQARKEAEELRKKGGATTEEKDVVGNSVLSSPAAPQAKIEEPLVEQLKREVFYDRNARQQPHYDLHRQSEEDGNHNSQTMEELLANLFNLMRNMDCSDSFQLYPLPNLEFAAVPATSTKP